MGGGAFGVVLYGRGGDGGKEFWQGGWIQVVGCGDGACFGQGRGEQRGL